MSKEKRKIAAYIKYLAAGCVSRIDAQKIKGPKRQGEAALHFFIGASAALQFIGETDKAEHIMRVCYFLIATRGMAEVRELAEGIPV